MWSSCTTRKPFLFARIGPKAVLRSTDWAQNPHGSAKPSVRVTMIGIYEIKIMWSRVVSRLLRYCHISYYCGMIIVLNLFVSHFFDVDSWCGSSRYQNWWQFVRIIVILTVGNAHEILPLAHGTLQLSPVIIKNKIPKVKKIVLVWTFRETFLCGTLYFLPCSICNWFQNLFRNFCWTKLIKN